MGKLYTKQGDNGLSFNPLTGSKKPKHEQFFWIVGSIDELQSWIGLVRSEIDENIGVNKNILKDVQLELYKLNSHIVTKGKTELSDEIVDDLEKEIDRMEEFSGEIKKFILPSGDRVACLAHVARSVCRRAERRLVEFKAHNEWVSEKAVRFLNRLSDYLFALARFINKKKGFQEEYVEV